MITLIVTHGLLLSIIHSHTLSFDAAALRARRRNCGHCESAHEHCVQGSGTGLSEIELRITRQWLGTLPSVDTR
ncbi:hypothetical protein BKA82DRAFT_2975137 [Pisolithus tinctorius]|nr:hypothetical protein BKA82DRAFT_2975137 [Pisolithus tinctorius]